MDLGLRDRVYVVTGGTKGLGFATAQCLVDDGAKVVVSSRAQESVDAALAKLGANARGAAADNADPTTPGRLVDLARSEFGRLDGALISVGGPPGTNPPEATEQQWRDAFEAVFLGGMRLTPALLAHLPAGASIRLARSHSGKSPVT